MTRETTIGVASGAGAAALAAYAVLGSQNPAPDQVSSLPFVIGFVVVVAALLFALLVPWAERRSAGLRSNRPGTVGLVCSVLGILTFVAFWSGLPIVLGGAGAALGMAGRERAADAGRGRLASAAILLGLFAIVLTVGLTVFEQMR